ncbi:MAG TPA: MtaA/CmuA family methyltransferase, partial [Methanomassiliicoccales archaeon]|nr:MtaA/CmuA family methyltransferase [Methanomassiliicoccales archaeon]
TGTIDLMKLSGSYWPEAHVNPETMANLAKAAHDMAGIESVRVPFDVGVDASAFGARTDQRRLIRQPAILERAVRVPEDLLTMQVPDPTRAGRAPVVLEALRLLRKRSKNTPVICGIVAPFMLACQLRGEQEAIIDLVLKPYFIKSILDLATEWNIAYAIAAIDAGADIICMVDGTSSGDVLEPSQYEVFSLPYQRRVAEAIAKHGGHSILHVCGNVSKNLKHMTSTGVHGISVDHCMQISRVKQMLEGKTAVIGNISPTSVLMLGTEMEVSLEVKKCIDCGTDVVSPGCGFAPETPLQNMRMLASTTKTYGPVADGRCW